MKSSRLDFQLVLCVLLLQLLLADASLSRPIVDLKGEGPPSLPPPATFGNGNDDHLLADLPPQVCEQAIKKLVREILKDPSTNIRLLPDRIEAKLYSNTVRLTLNAIYRSLHCWDGKPFLLGHEFKLQHYPEMVGKTYTFEMAKTSNVNIELLEEVSDRLLENKNINQAMIPDVLERQIYINCLKVVFRVLNILQSSFRINFCGHSLGFYLNGTSTSFASDTALRRASSIMSNLSSDQLHEFQRNAGAEEYKPSFFQGKHRRAWLSQIHATMFGLVLQIVQDMLDQSAIEFVGIGKIVMDLVPAGNTRNTPTPQVNVVDKSSLTTFASGMGLGVLMMIVLTQITVDLPLDKWIQKVSIFSCKRFSRLREFCNNVFCRSENRRKGELPGGGGRNR
jgi:hypothetical protein